ncbi:MAG: hypothetical protein V1902_01295 [Candidatus Falkowbacteria bacterium]
MIKIKFTKFNAFLFIVLLFFIVSSIIRIAIAAAPNPGHTWSEITSAAATVAQGGTGQISLTANSILLGNTAAAVQLVAPSTSGNVLKSNGTTWSSATPSGSIIFGSRSGASMAQSCYCHPNAGICNPTSNATYGIDVPIAGTIKNLKVYMTTAPAAGGNTCAFTVNKATLCTGSFSATELTCTVTGDGSTKICADTVNTVSISAGECLQVVFTETGACTGNNSWSFEYAY